MNMDENSTMLTLEPVGEGSFNEYVKSVIMDSARAAVDAGVDISDKS